jgi:hypothetical protein
MTVWLLIAAVAATLILWRVIGVAGAALLVMPGPATPDQPVPAETMSTLREIKTR